MKDMLTINDFLLFDSVWLMAARTVHVYGSCCKANDQPIMRIHGTCFQMVIYSQQITMLSLNLLPNFKAYFKFDAINFDVFPLLAAYLSFKLPWIFPGAPLKINGNHMCKLCGYHLISMNSRGSTYYHSTRFWMWICFQNETLYSFKKRKPMAFFT